MGGCVGRTLGGGVGRGWFDRRNLGKYVNPPRIGNKKCSTDKRNALFLEGCRSLWSYFERQIVIWFGFQCTASCTIVKLDKTLDVFAVECQRTGDLLPFSGGFFFFFLNPCLLQGVCPMVDSTCRRGDRVGGERLS